MIGDVRSGLFRFARQIAGGLSRTAGLGLGFWQTFRGSGVWITRGLKFNQTHASRATAHRPAPLQAGARSTRRGVKSWGGGIHWGGVLFGCNRDLTCSQSVPKFQNSRGGKVKNWLAPDLTTLNIKSIHHRAYDNVFFLISKTCLQFPR